MFNPVAAVKAMLTKKYVYRSSVTGKFVSALYASLHPETTIRERVK